VAAAPVAATGVWPLQLAASSGGCPCPSGPCPSRCSSLCLVWFLEKWKTLVTEELFFVWDCEHLWFFAVYIYCTSPLGLIVGGHLSGRSRMQAGALTATGIVRSVFVRTWGGPASACCLLPNTSG
jgi:hypothetical protein